MQNFEWIDNADGAILFGLGVELDRCGCEVCNNVTHWRIVIMLGWKTAIVRVF